MYFHPFNIHTTCMTFWTAHYGIIWIDKTTSITVQDFYSINDQSSNGQAVVTVKLLQSCMLQVYLIAECFLSVLGNDTFRISLLNLSDFYVL